MDLTLSPAQLELQARARAFVERGAAAARGRVRAGGRPAVAPSGAARSVRRPSRRTSTAARCRGRSAARAGRRSSRSSSTSSSGRSTGGLWSYVPGAVQRADPVRCRRSGRAISSRRSAASARAGTRSPRTGAGSDARTLRRDRGPGSGDRRLRPQRREVVRHRAGRHGLHDLPLQRRRRRPAPADAVPRRLRHARRAAAARPGLHAHVRRPAPQFVLEDVRVPAGAILGGWGRPTS